MHIKILQNGQWKTANPDYNLAYQNYKNRPMYSPEIPITTGNLTVYRKYNDCYLPTYISDGQNEIPIADFDDVKVFLQDLNPVDWYNARDYQVWAYFDFMYDNINRKTYASKYSSYLAYPPNTRTVTEIDIDGLPPNVIFSISRNENNSVYYERNDPRGTRVRICDNNTARIGYRGYYTRMTMDVGMVVISNANFNASPLSLPLNLVLEKTDIEEEQCIMCYSNKRNLIFRPCNHNISCSECYLKFDKKLECPMCKGNIVSLDK
jgi:hypothetical protein